LCFDNFLGENAKVEVSVRGWLSAVLLSSAFRFTPKRAQMQQEGKSPGK
jgi:hypothetical protein